MGVSSEEYYSDYKGIEETVTWTQLIDYYQEKFDGIIDDTMSQLLERSEDLILSIIGRVKSPTEEEVGAYIYNWYVKAVCAQAEYYSNNGGDEYDDNSFSIGSYSESGKSNGSSNTIMSNGLTKRAYMYLNNTGLLYRGLAGVRRTTIYD